MKQSLREVYVGSRKSRLAIEQVKEVLFLLKEKGIDFSFRHKAYDTAGDKDKKTPLSANQKDDFFTDSLDEALLQEEIDVAVHSAKDLPKDIPEGLSVFALTEALDKTDAFVGRLKISELKPNARIGTSSLLRKESVQRLKPDVEVIDIRGSIEERISLVDKGAVDGIIVATCALKRLGLEKRVMDILPYEATPLQGRLAVVGRAVDADLKKLFSVIDAKMAERCKKVTPRILYLGTNPEKYHSLGSIIHLPMIEIAEVANAQEIFDELTAEISRYDLILFTSRFSVIHFFNLIQMNKDFLLEVKKKDFAVIGKETASVLKERGVETMIQPEIETSEGLLEALIKSYPLEGKRILFPRSSLPNLFLQDGLRSKNASVKVFTIYENKKPKKRELFFNNIDMIVFTSPSTVRNFLEDYGRVPEYLRIFSKGAITKKALQEVGYESEDLPDD